MAGYKGDGDANAAVDEYRKLLLLAARDRVVADAEHEVCVAWAAELAHVGHMTRLGVATARAACEAARALVRARQADGDPHALSQARLRLELAEEQARQSLEAADALLELIGDEQALMALAAEERTRVAEANRDRLFAAWQAAHGPAAGPAPTGTDAAEPTPRSGGRKRFRWTKDSGSAGN